MPFESMDTSSNEGEGNIDDVVGRVLGGASAEFETIIHLYEKPLRVWLVSHSGSFVDIDDVLQAAFLTAYSKLHEYEPGSNFGGWIFSIARFQLMTELSRLRRQASNRNRFAAELLHREVDRQKETTFLIMNNRLEYLEHCLDRLREPDRELVRWRYDEGIPLVEMATRRGRSLTAIKKDLWRIRRRLHTCISTRISHSEDFRE